MEANGEEEAGGRRVGLGKGGEAREGERQGGRAMDARGICPHLIASAPGGTPRCHPLGPPSSAHDVDY